MPPGFPGWLSGKESPANAEDTGDKGSIPGSGRSLEKGMVIASSMLAWRTHGQRSLAGHSPWGHKESDMTVHRVSQMGPAGES